MSDDPETVTVNANIPIKELEKLRSIYPLAVSDSELVRHALNDARRFEEIYRQYS